ncbi:MAG: hypothetical protein R3200_02365 [Xanthomonadales bacterium]|nr:hypothetical protein [Xanthomonadales bacterium]
MLAQLPWDLVAVFAASGILMALVSCLIGLPPMIENPLWWLVYATWVYFCFQRQVEPLFLTLLVSSALAGLLHGSTSAVLLDRYIENNPWHANKMQGSSGKLIVQFIAGGIIIGVVFGAAVGAIAWALRRFLLT